MFVYLLQSFNELILRPSWFALDVGWRFPYALYRGIRAAAVEAGLDIMPASILAGFVSAGLLLGFLWLCARVARWLRIKEPSPATLKIGAALFWLGCAVGIYFFGLLLYAAAMPDASASILSHVAGTALLVPALGWFTRYMLGGKRAPALIAPAPG